MNKFLKQYPQLREPKVGDPIKFILSHDNKIFSVGDIGTIIHMSERYRIYEYPKYSKEYCIQIKINTINFYSQFPEYTYAWVTRKYFEIV